MFVLFQCFVGEFCRVAGEVAVPLCNRHCNPPHTIHGHLNPCAKKKLKIQALITTCVDTSVHLGLLQMHEQEGSWGGSRATAGTWGR